MSEHYATHQKKVHIYIKKKFPKYFSEVNEINFFSTFLEWPRGHGNIYNRKNRKEL